MEVRGLRECKACGTEWSYYETGSPSCPECGSLYSVGVGTRKLHTDRPMDLELDAAIDALEEEDYRQAGELGEERARKYVHRRGFISAGELRPLADSYVAAQEIRYVASHLRTGVHAGRTGTELDLDYVTDLFESAAAGSRPSAAAVPEGLWDSRGLGVADAVGDYREAIKTYLDATETAPEIDRALDRLDSHVRRVRALDGAIEPQSADRLLEAARTIGRYLGEEVEGAAVEAALEALEDSTH